LDEQWKGRSNPMPVTDVMYDMMVMDMMDSMVLIQIIDPRERFWHASEAREYAADVVIDCKGMIAAPGMHVS
jgi:hypothetical protein